MFRHALTLVLFLSFSPNAFAESSDPLPKVTREPQITYYDDTVPAYYPEPSQPEATATPEPKLIYPVYGSLNVE